MTKVLFHIVVAVAIIVGGSGCGKKVSEPTDSQLTGSSENQVKKPASATITLPRKRVSDRPENQNGVVFIAEYHHIREGKSAMERSPKDFKADLERLYRLGFRPINVTEYLSGDFNLPPGASPVVLTFDDANPSQVKLLPDGQLDPNCGLGILKTFSEKHPDFPPKAVFFVLPELWAQPKEATKKVQLIRSWGGEVANHTMTHPNLSKLSDEKVKEEIAGSFKLLETYRGHPEYLALPLGISPKNRTLLKSFDHGGKRYAMKAVFLVGANPALPPISAKFDSQRIPRIQACEGPMGLNYWLDRVDKGKLKPFVTP